MEKGERGRGRRCLCSAGGRKEGGNRPVCVPVCKIQQHIFVPKKSPKNYTEKYISFRVKMFLFLIFTFCLVKARFVRDFLHLSLLPFPPSFQEKFQPAANAVWQPRGRRGGGRGKGFPSSLFLLCGSRGIG